MCLWLLSVSLDWEYSKFSRRLYDIVRRKSLIETPQMSHRAWFHRGRERITVSYPECYIMCEDGAIKADVPISITRTCFLGTKWRRSLLSSFHQP